eukprot:CAMPEP_0180195546 /NCGR_PEP_ID=MMETSP0987-20121128/3634_1 /TAXON_ID=697907 /ORGANISM="non described non described, Strain CCMP2293" /LENGTH=200 /DNA_ID=CAMNT_0022150373 /DNA_START=445 /DNA_END=1047 /DNA_ORIENTATION=-
MRAAGGGSWLEESAGPSVGGRVCRTLQRNPLPQIVRRGDLDVAFSPEHVVPRAWPAPGSDGRSVGEVPTNDGSCFRPGVRVLRECQAVLDPRLWFQVLGSRDAETGGASIVAGVRQQKLPALAILHHARVFAATLALDGSEHRFALPPKLCARLPAGIRRMVVSLAALGWLGVQHRAGAAQLVRERGSVERFCQPDPRRP